MGKVTIGDVAELAGVSKSTVSRVLNKSGYVNETTLKKIEDAIAQLKFIPSQAAVNLSKSKTNMIGFLVPDICNNFFSEIYYTASKIAEEEGYHLLLINTDDNAQIEEAALNSLLSQGICGLIMTPVSEKSQNNMNLLKFASSRGVPIVFIDREIEGFYCDSVFVDNIQSTKKIVELLIQEGHTNIAALTGPKDTVPGKERELGFKVALAENSIPLEKENIIMANFKEEDAYEATKALLAREHRPTAIFSSNNLMTVGAVKAIYESGLKIPDDISFAGFDDVAIMSSFGIELTVIDRPTFGMGKIAMRILLQRIEKNEPFEKMLVQRVVLPTKLVIRGSEKFIKK